MGGGREGREVVGTRTLILAPIPTSCAPPQNSSVYVSPYSYHQASNIYYHDGNLSGPKQCIGVEARGRQRERGGMIVFTRGAQLSLIVSPMPLTGLHVMEDEWRTQPPQCPGAKSSTP